MATLLNWCGRKDSNLTGGARFKRPATVAPTLVVPDRIELSWVANQATALPLNYGTLISFHIGRSDGTRTRIFLIESQRS